MTGKFAILVCALSFSFCFSNASMAGVHDDHVNGEARISLNLKGSKFGDVLRALAQLYTLNYSISSSAAGASGPPSGSWPSPQQQGPLSPHPSQNSWSGQQSAQAGQGINDITVNFAYKGDSVDEAVKLLCRGADVFCEKRNDIWVISRYEVYIIDKDVFFTYSVSGGGTSVGGTAQTGSTVSAAGAPTTGGVAASPTTGVAGTAVSGTSGTDSIGISGNFDDFVLFVKTFLSKDGTVQISKNGYLVVIDIPSAIAKIRQVMEKDTEMNERVSVKVDVIRVDLTDNYSAGVNWNAVMKRVTVNGGFAPANAFSFGYNTTLAGNAISTLLSVLGDYGKSRVVKSWETTARNGIPIFFNVTENIPYFTQSQALTTGVSQTATTVNYVNVGLKIKILPNIRQDTFNGGIYAETSELVSMASSGGTNPTTAPDTSLTNTAVPLELKWGNSFVLTGFKTKQNSISATGIPLLSKLPIVGALFGYQEKDSVGSEIAIVVTATKNGNKGVSKDAE